ncbi:ABC-three component system protein [Legionella sp.]|uniref:ABC-three component system protein n=1 Tax=Legionella sp. TaxID=459 RepID=UPI003C801D26
MASAESQPTKWLITCAIDILIEEHLEVIDTTILISLQSIIDEFQLKIIAKRKNYQSFDDVIEYMESW